MSIAAIDSQTYKRIYTNTVAALINRGMDLIAARALAQEQMDNAFAPDEVINLREADLDSAEKGIYS